MRDGPSIALINDDTRFLELACALLERRGFRTVCYLLADETYATLCRERPDLIIVSLASERPMPIWNLLTLLCLDRTTAAIPLLLSSPDTRLLAEKLGQLGAVGCDVLEEPFTERQLMAKVMAPFSRLVVWDHDL